MKKTTFIIIAILILFPSCVTWKTLNKMGNEVVDKNEFYTAFPFTLYNNESIHINTYWGSNNELKVLKLDNHAPTAIDEHLIGNIQQVQFIGNSILKKRTPDGKGIPNKIYYYDEGIRLGDITFHKVVLNAVPDRTTRNDMGLLGGNLMEKGIWKIDFEKREILFTSSLDSIADLKNAEIIESKFTFTNSIKFKVQLDQKMRHIFEFDLGYNGALILPKKDFDRFHFEDSIKSSLGKMGTAVGAQEAHYFFVENQMFEIGDKSFTSNIMANDLNKKLSFIGLGFWKEFKFIIIDYNNKKFYVSKELKQ